MQLSNYTSDIMHNLKTRIKRKRERLTRGHGSHDESSSTKSAGADWEFVNFNPFVYGPSKRPTSTDSIPPGNGNGNVSLVKAKQAHHEDYYEFPTSTKLSIGIGNPEVLERRGTGSSPQSKQQRHSINSTFDLLADHGREEPTLNKYNPLLSPPPKPPSSGSFVTTISPTCTFYLPVPPDRRSQRSSLVLTSPEGPPPPLPPPALRPRSWASDSGTGTLVVHRGDEKDSSLRSNSSSVKSNASSSSSSRGSGTFLQSGLTRHGLLTLGEQVCQPLIGDRPLANSSGSSNLKNDRRPDTLSEERLANDGRTYEEEDGDSANHEPRRSSNAVGRSESCKETTGHHKKQTRERRKHSDPSLTSKSSDVDLENQRHLSDANNSGSSSNSSLSARSAGADSPSSSIELVNQSGHHSSSSLPGRNSETPETLGHSDSYKTPQSWDGDSDIEVEQDPPDWMKNVPEETLASLTPREKKRQEVLNELFHTERSHVRNIKVLDKLFHRPIRNQQFLPPELIQMLFGHLEEMLIIHGHFNEALKKKKRENPLIGDIGPVLLEVFDGEVGVNFKQCAAKCCSRQQIGLKALKEKREKNPKLNAFLTEAEQDPVCRRLQIQDMIPMAMQRLTKYPLIFENLNNCTDVGTAERLSIQKAVDMSKEILNSVNQAKKEAEDYQRLVEIQRRTDRSSLDKAQEKGADSATVNELKNLDLTKHRLIREGTLLWRTKTNKQKGDVLQEVQLLLLHDMLVILMKQDERYFLKVTVTNSFTHGKNERVVCKPIIKLNQCLHRANASSKTAFMVISMMSTQMYELVCSSQEERKQWLLHITKAAEDYKNRQQDSRRDPLPNSNIPPSVPEAEERNKELIEAGESGEGDQSVPGREDGSSPQKDTGPENQSGSPVADPQTSPDSDGKLLAGNGKPVSASPNPSRKVGEFLRVTESAPLIDPKEVVVATREIHFAQPVVSQYEELKKMDNSINKALEEKLKLASNILHIPTPPSTKDNHSQGGLDENSKDVKDLVVACMQKVDQLGRILATQKITSESVPTFQEQSNIQQSLNNLLTQLLSEVHRKDEELEMRRQELHRVREQNHGYQERLQSLSSKLDKQGSSDAAGLSSSSPTLSPDHSRPNSFLSVSSSSEPHDDEHEVVMMKDPSKLKLSDPVAISNSNNNTSSTSASAENPELHLDATPLQPELSSNDNTPTAEENHIFESACDLAQEEFADALEEVVTTAGAKSLEVDVGTSEDSSNPDPIPDKMISEVDVGDSKTITLVKSTNGYSSGQDESHA